MTKNKPDPDPNPPTGEYDGAGETFKDAAHAAWLKAKEKKQGDQTPPQWFEVKKTWVYLENPIREYKVRIKG